MPAARKPAARKPAASKPAESTTAGRGATQTSSEESTATERVGLHNLKPAPGSRRPRKRVGRGEGSGTGKTSGRGQKGWGSRSGAKRRTRFEGGQMPIHMRMRKLRGPHSKGSMPFEPFRTHTQAVNLKDLDARFEKGEAVTLEALKSKGLATRRNIPVKILAKGELSKPLTVHAHAFSGKAREAIEAAGGTCQVLEAASKAAENETA
jgi:large subunit ribosomal protein L15